MKKILSLVLALSLLCGAVALADTMTVTLTLQEGYVITIPSEAKFALNTNEDDGSTYYHAQNTIAVSGILPADFSSIEFSVSGSYDAEGWHLYNESDDSISIPYYINAFLPYQEDAVFVEGDEVFMILNKENYAAVEAFNCDLHFDLGETTNKPAGNYTDTLTFNLVEK